jgi:hypothetical protein
MAIATNSLNRAVPGGKGVFATNFSSADASGGEIIEADPGADKSIVLEYLVINCAADDTVTIRADTATILGPFTFKAAAPVPIVLDLREGGIILTANTELQVITGGANAVAGYVEGKVIEV